MKTWKHAAIVAAICAGILVSPSVARVIIESNGTILVGPPGALFSTPYNYCDVPQETIPVGPAWFQGYRANVSVDVLERAANVELYDEDGPVAHIVKTTTDFPGYINDWNLYIIVINIDGTWYVGYCDASVTWYVDSIISALDATGAHYQTWGA